LKRVDAIYACVPVGVQAVTDRTPLDMLGYTMAEAIGDNVSEEDQARFAKYAQDCFDVTNKRFANVLLVQPGITIVPQKGKAVANAAYMEHLNSLILGLTVDPRLQCGHYYIPRSFVSIEERVSAMEGALRRSEYMASMQVTSYIHEGGHLH
jgi:hypothetical protein